MQLTKFSNINGALAAATCTLLAGVSNAQADEKSNDWQFDTAIMYYGEPDRVQAVEGVVSATKDFGDEHVFSTKLVLDTLTGASANGAVAQTSAQTFTRPSGNGEYTIEAGDTPLDDTFRDTRVQLNLAWNQPWGANQKVGAGLHISNEYDYLSVALNANYALDFNRKNTTFSVAASYAADEYSPEGGIPLALSKMAIRGDFANDDAFKAGFDDTRIGESENKDTLDVIFGLSQVINRRWLVQFNYGYSQVDGYLTDPFKVVSLVDDTGSALGHYYESRPDSRSKHSIFAQSKYHFDSLIWDMSYRLASDDWGIDSHTLESRLYIPLSDSAWITPHVRYYQQSAADFYRPFVQGDLAEYMSADYRIGQMTAYTLGLKYTQKLSDGDELSMRLEYYQQTPENSGFSNPGQLADVDLYPSVSAVIFQLGYKF